MKQVWKKKYVFYFYSIYSTVFEFFCQMHSWYWNSSTYMNILNIFLYHLLIVFVILAKYIPQFIQIEIHMFFFYFTYICTSFWGPNTFLKHSIVILKKFIAILLNWCILFLYYLQYRMYFLAKCIPEIQSYLFSNCEQILGLTIIEFYVHIFIISTYLVMYLFAAKIDIHYWSLSVDKNVNRSICICPNNDKLFFIFIAFKGIEWVKITYSSNNALML